MQLKLHNSPQRRLFESIWTITIKPNWLYNNIFPLQPDLLDFDFEPEKKVVKENYIIYTQLKKKVFLHKEVRSSQPVERATESYRVQLKLTYSLAVKTGLK